MSYLIGESMTGGYGGADILHDCTIAAEQGEIAVIVGPNGAGKSTAMKAVFGMLNLNKGRVVLDGEDITSLSPQDRVARGMAFVPQNNNVFPSMSVEENLEMGAFLRRDDISTTMEQVFDLFPILKEKRRQNAGELSGGQRQQVAVGRSLMTQPKLLMLDEPTAGVSPIVMDELFDRISSQKLFRWITMAPDTLNAFALLANFVLVPAVAYGSQLALGALGVTLVYGILRFSNFAHGDTMALGTMFTILITWWFQSLGLSLGPLPTALLALPFAIAICALFVLLSDRMVYRFYRRQRADPVIFVIASVGVMFVMNGVVRFIIGPNDQNFADGQRFIIKAREFKQMTGLSEGISIKVSQGITVVTMIVVVAALFWFLNRTRTGKSMRAYSDNEDLALLSGINPDRVVMVTWILAAALATIAGTLYGLDKSFKPFTYFQLLLPIFASAIVGGLGNPLGAIAGGFVIAFSEITVTYAYKKFANYIVPGDWKADGLMQLLSTNYKFAVSFLILLLVLLFRPTGIFKGKAV